MLLYLQLPIRMRVFFLLLVIAAVLAGASYAGARATAGKLTGATARGLGPASTRFALGGISAIRGRPRGWVIAYPEARQFGPAGAAIYVSPTGRLLGTRPADLAQRLDAQRAEELP
jgi:hypothetical protein